MGEPALSYRPDPAERRSEPRFASDLPVDLLESTGGAVPQPINGKVLDISATGLRVRVWHNAAIGSYLSLNVDRNGYDSLCVGEVIWRRETTAGMIYGLRVAHWTFLDPLLQFAMQSRINRPDLAPAIDSPHRSNDPAVG